MLVAATFFAWRTTAAQGTTTASLGGAVTSLDSATVDGADVTVINLANGFRVRSVVRRGRYLVQGLPIGGPYVLEVRRIGYQVLRQSGITLTLGADARVDVAMVPAAQTLPRTLVIAKSFAADGGVSSSVSDSLLRRLPMLNRDIYDLVRLDSHLSTRFGVISADGVNAAFNTFSIDGMNDRALGGGNALGAIGGGKSIPLEAVEEYRILLSPYDVRQGEFAGASIEAVTKSGTNTLAGSIFGFYRNEQLTRDISATRDSPYSQSQFGFALGGPIVRDRLHFFVASEFQLNSTPAPGPYLGQPVGTEPPLLIDTAEVAHFARIMRDQYGLNVGSAAAASNRNPVQSFFGRLDLELPEWSSRLTGRYNFSHALAAILDRTGYADDGIYPLTTWAFHQTVVKQQASLQLATNLPRGAYNQLTLGFYYLPVDWAPTVRQPEVRATVRAADTSTAAISLEAGSFAIFQGDTRLEQRSFEAGDYITAPLGDAHRLTAGLRVERFRLRRAGVPYQYGSWTFASLDSLQQGVADSYQLSQDRGGGDKSVAGSLFSAFVGDAWRATDRLELTLGMRADVPAVIGAPPYSAAVDSVFGRRTDVTPASTVQWSPRLGFRWDATGDGTNTLRGGGGVFVGRPFMQWYVNAFTFFGAGVARLSCGGPGDPYPPPHFVPDYRLPPQQCANGTGSLQVDAGEVNLLSPHLKYPTVLRLSLGYDRRLPWSLIATAEGVYTRNIVDYFFLDRNLRGAVGTDRSGRVMYGTIAADGTAVPDHLSAFEDVIEVSNQSRNYSYSATARLEKKFSDRAALRVAYTFSQVRDLQTQIDPFASSNWQANVASGNLAAPPLATSDRDQPHRVVVVGTVRLPWSPWSTDVSASYVGGSGTPFTYVADADLNADGVSFNDPIYVPRNAADTSEIRFDPAGGSVSDQQKAFEAFVRATPCLRDRRGHLVTRNSCRSPWVHTSTFALRQSIPIRWGHPLSLELQIFNALNLLSGRWGRVEEPNPVLLQLTGETTGDRGTQRPIFTFFPSSTGNVIISPDSYYQIQLALRVAF